MIQRDGALTSLWQGNVASYIVTNRPDQNVVYDVIIVGGGITGISTALLLQEAGKQCLVLEAVEIGFGTTGGTTAHLNTLLDTPYYVIAQNFGEENAAHVAAATAAAIGLIRDNVQRFGIDCGFKEADAYLFAQDKEQEKELEKIRESRVPSEIPVTIAIRNNFVFDGILEMAREIRADLIITSTHGRTGLRHLMMGSTAENIVQRAPCPVLVVRDLEHDFV